MIKYVAFISLIALRIFSHPSNATTVAAPFASPAPIPAVITAPAARVISIDGSISSNKVVLNWVIGENEAADQFEVEKSTDGKHFILAALVFGTDRPDTDKYQFYEKAGNQKIHYRIKLISKDRQAVYSAVVEINPNA